MNLSIFQNPRKFFQIFFRFSKYRFCKKIEATTVQLLIQSREKFLCVIYNLGTEKDSKLTLRSFFQILHFFSKDVKNNWKNLYAL